MKNRLAPVVDEGSYILFPGHRVLPDVTNEYCLHFVELAHCIKGQGKNLPPQFVRNENPIINASLLLVKSLW